MNSPTTMVHKPHWMAVLAAALLTLCSITLIIGWHVSPLFPHDINQHAAFFPRSHTVVIMMLASITLWLQCYPAPFRHRLANRAFRGLAQGLAVLVIIGGLLSLANIFWGLDQFIDPYLLTMNWQAYLLKTNAVSLLGALGFILAGASLLLLDRPTRSGRYPAEYCALTMAAVMCIPMMGYLFNVQALTEFAPVPAISRQAPPAFVMLAIGILFSRPAHPMMSILLSPAPGGRLLRSVLPVTLVLLVTLDLLAKWGAGRGFYDHDMISPLALLVGSALLLVLFWRAALMLNHEYGSRLKGEAELARTHELLRIVSDFTTEGICVKDQKGCYIFANPAALSILGKDQASVIGHTSAEVFPDPDVATRIEENNLDVLKEGKAKSVEFPIDLPRGQRTYYLTEAPWFGQNSEVLGSVGITTDITDRKRIEEAMKAHETRLENLVESRTLEVRELIGHLQTMREEEKRAIARELHDDLGSSLTALNMHLAILFQQMPNDVGITERIVQIKALLQSITATKRRIQSGLRPDKLDIFGIKTAISDQAQEFETYTGVTCSVSLPDEDIQYSSQVEISLFRMVQETLNNIAKHAKATHVDIILDDNDEEIYLTIRDNGIGISSQKLPSNSTHGLRGMRERVVYLGGTIAIESAPGSGTRIKIKLPKFPQGDGSATAALEKTGHPA
ncbi:ATP-binding protein [Janthinobacterium sp. 17J80-10]|uniref:PAS domain-containing sensor histidine kinase n=1 Tax=Janthinobacterium sp. 17J80-10 TaxID=2497863 RepID=UPI00100530BA|nr:ATP-binding protein [Janthinobacterium sp. 17J80-10]QAU34983.1 PAS domain S-box protein [Janthinobacterium sp. 17J80-10]